MTPKSFPKRLALALLGGFVLATQAQAGVQLRHKASPGEEAAYQMRMDGSTVVFVTDRRQKTELATEIFLKQIVDDVSDQGVITYTTVIESGQIKVNNVPSTIPNVGQRVKSEMLPNGKILNTQGMQQQLNLNQLQLIFPDDPVEVGSTWSKEIEPSLQVPVPLRVRYKIVGFEKIKGFKCIKILSEIRSGKKSNIEGLNLSVKADGKIFFAYEKGLIVKNEVNSSMDMILKRVIDNKSESIITKMKMDMNMEWQY